ncbi:hypothetical protein GCM10010124_26830 [Pilimelia terevasa]|uniref:HTH cro/C1-type domain-containing protein n=1 Tax=Pilimelia terevasa TaxID=53372 RepID=A0A8J3BV57_9ACTN|nr:PD40 domain-containing protein [Pilimelia terevasa]GGK32690.1 hypothetical protein GCM10010124_26830 [Pilimelia terevasa]
MARPERVLDPTAGPVQEFAAALRLLRRSAGNPGYRTLADRAGYSPSTLSDAAGGRRLPGLAVVRGFVAACGGDPAEWEERWRAASAALTAQANVRTGRDADAPPYLGLASFQLGDAGRYFGREALIADLAARAGATGLLAVVGASGSGKSSLLRAGLVPALTGEAGAAPLIVTPGERPMDEHRAALAGPLPGVIAVDQFEEVFTLCRDAAQRADFIDVLLDAAAEPGVVVLIALRPDFYGHCARYERLATALAGATAPLGPMTEEELSRAVTAPARTAGLSVERALVTKVLADAAGQTGALPLVSHALLETWRHRQGTQLTLAAYEATGGLTRAVAQTAEREYAALGAAAQAAARDLLTRLTALGEGTADTPRRVYTAELDRPATAEVVERFARARLLVVGEDTVEIAHEALITTWPRLRAWLTEDRESLRIHRRLTDAATVWDGLGREDGDLYRGPRLTIAREWADRPGRAAELNTVEREFLHAAVSAEDAERAAATRRARQIRRLTAGLAVLLTLALLGAGTALWQWREAVTQRQAALSRQLAAEATAVARTDVPRALALAAGAYRAADTVEARGALLSLAGHQVYAGRLVHSDAVKEVAFSPDDRELALAGQDGAIGVWDLARRRVRTRLLGHDGAVRTIAYQPGGSLLSSGGLDGTVRLWEPARPGEPRVIHRGAAPVNGVEFSPDGTLLAAVFTSGEVRVWRVSDGTVRHRFAMPRGDRSDLHFNPGGDRLAVTGGDGRVTVWALAPGGRGWTVPAGAEPAEEVRFAPGGRLVASAGDSGVVYLRDAANGALRRILRGHHAGVRAMAFAPDGHTLITGDTGGVVYRWDVERGRPRAELVGNTTVPYSIAVSADGETIASGGRDRTALIWRRGTLPLAGPPGEIGNLAQSPDGRTLAATNPPQIVGGVATQETVLWDADSRRVRADDHTDVTATPTGPPEPPRALPAQPLLTWYQREAHLWDAAAGRRVRALRGFDDRQLAGDLHPASETAAVAGTDDTIRLFDGRTGALRAALHQPGRIYAVRFSPDGRRLISVTAGGVISVWDVAARATTAVWASGVNVVDVAVRADLGEVALGGGDGAISFWDTAAGRLRYAGRPAHAGAVDALAYSPDGRTLASGGHDTTVVLWDIALGRSTATLRGHRAAVTTALWSPDGATLYTGGADSAVIPWPVDAGRAYPHVCARLAADFPDHPRTACP